MEIKLTKKEKELIALALKEYEERHYEMESQDWQKKINNLMEKF